jgi:hypothetical protein
MCLAPCSWLLTSYFSRLTPGSVFPTLLSAVTCPRASAIPARRGSTLSRQRGSWLLSKVTLFSGTGFVIEHAARIAREKGDGRKLRADGSAVAGGLPLSYVKWCGGSGIGPACSPEIAARGTWFSRSGCGSVRCTGRLRRAWGRCGSRGRAMSYAGTHHARRKKLSRRGASAQKKANRD